MLTPSNMLTPGLQHMDLDEFSSTETLAGFYVLCKTHIIMYFYINPPGDKMLFKCFSSETASSKHRECAESFTQLLPVKSDFRALHKLVITSWRRTNDRHGDCF